MSRDRPRRHRRPTERLLLTTLGVAAGFGFLATFVLGYAVWQLDQVERFEVNDVLTAPTMAPITASDLLRLNAPQTQTVDESATETTTEILLPPAITDPVAQAENYLLVGSDSVEGISATDVIMTGRSQAVGNHLADTIMILRLRNDGTAAVVSVPRDLLVPIASTDSIAKINSAYNLDSSAQTLSLIHI